MFSFKKKAAPVKGKPAKSSNSRNDFSLPGIPGFDSNVRDDDDDDLEAELFALTGVRKNQNEDFGLMSGDGDDDLEAELAKIIGGGGKKKRTEQLRVQNVPLLKSSPQSLDRVSSIDDGDDEDIDENDPDLLGELHMLTCEDNDNVIEDEDSDSKSEESEEKPPNQINLIRERLEVYRLAENIAKGSNEAAKARRFNRGVKTLEKLLKRVEGGEIVGYDEIPPEIAKQGLARAPAPKGERQEPPKLYLDQVSTQHPVAQISSPTNEEAIKESDISDEIVDNSKPTLKDSSKPTSERGIIIDSTANKSVVIAESPQPIESQAPTALPVVESKIQPKPAVKVPSGIMQCLLARRDEYRKAALAAKRAENKPKALEFVRVSKAIEKLIEASENGMKITEQQLPPSPVMNFPQGQASAKIEARASSMPAEIFTMPKTVMEALNQRLNYYSKAALKAENSGMRTDAKKYGDVARVYQNSIKLYQKGGNVPFEKLPTPPGCPPIPVAFKI